MNNRPIRMLALCAVLTAPVLLAACGDSDPAPATSDQVTTSTTTEAMTDGDGMDDGKTTTTEAMSEDPTTTEAMTDGDSMDDGKTSTTEAMTEGDSMDEGKTSTTEAPSGDSMSEG